MLRPFVPDGRPTGARSERKSHGRPGDFAAGPRTGRPAVVRARSLQRPPGRARGDAAADERTSRSRLLGHPARPRRGTPGALAPRAGPHDLSVVLRELGDGGGVPEPRRTRRQGAQHEVGLHRLAAERLRASDRRRRRRTLRRPRHGRHRRRDHGDARGQPRHEGRHDRARRDVDGRGVPARGARESDEGGRVRGAALRGLRHVARRSAGRGGGMGRRLLVLVLPEGARLPARDRAHRAERPRHGAGARPQDASPVLLRHRRVGEVLDRPAYRVPPHDADPAVLRAVHRHPSGAERGHGEPLGSPRGCRSLLPAGDDVARLRAARRPRPPAGGAHRDQGARGDRRQGGPRPVPPRVRPGGRWRSRTDGAADLAGRPDGREREPRDRRQSGRPVRHPRAALSAVFFGVEAGAARMRRPERRLTTPPAGGSWMADKARLHRSELAVPGTNVRAMEKAPTLGADLVFLDLEDAVAPDDKEQARANVIDALGAHDWTGTAVSVRIDGLDTHWCYRDVVDVAEARGEALDTLLVPKVGAPSDVEFVATLLDQIEQRNGWPDGRIGLHILIETAKGMADVEAISRARPDRLEAMVFGVADYAASVQARTTNIGGANPDYAVLTDPDDGGIRE